MKRKLLAVGSACLTLIAIAAMLMTGSEAALVDAAASRDQPWLLSTGRPAYASSTNGNDKASYITDSNLGTQWGAAANLKDQWIDIDLGANADISSVEIDWQNNASYGVDYEILVSANELNWTSIYRQTNGNGGYVTDVYNKSGVLDYSYMKEVISNISGNGRYVRLLVHTSKDQQGKPADQGGWGASVREIKIYGKGGVVDPVSTAPNLAQGKPVTVSSHVQPWWASQPLAGSNAVDNDYDSYWLSEGGEKEWFQVDLGRAYTVGRVFIQWQVEFGRMFDIQVSADGTNWRTAYRDLQGCGEDPDVYMYQENVRYVRMQGIAMGRGSGYSIREIKVYEYENNDPRENPTIPALPTAYVVQVGSGSYLVDDAGKKQPREPIYVTNNIDTPIPSNDWWTSIIYRRLSDHMPALPLVYKYEETGLSMYYGDTLYTRDNQGGQGADSRYFDLSVTSSAITGVPSARVDGYGDWSVDVVYSDDDTPKMRSTMVKGSPFTYNTFTNPSTVEVSIQDLMKFFDKNGNTILTNDGDTVTADCIGLLAHNMSERPGSENPADSNYVDKNQYHYYGLFAPEGTTFTRVGSRVKIQLGSNQNYLNIGVLQNESEISYVYRFAYATVTDTIVNYNFDEASSRVTTTYQSVVSNKRTGAGFAGTTLMGLMPHQWKNSSDSVNKSYVSARGEMKMHEGNSFSYSLAFHGVVPSFTEPVESSSYDREDMEDYLALFAKGALTDYWVADPYWQGKKSHPIVMGIEIAEQLGDYETRDELISTLRKILVNWLSYDGEDEYPYYLYYHTSWGALSGDGGDHGMAINLSDHHFLWAYFIYPAAILASYDESFVAEYGDMLEIMIRDCMNPDKDDELFPFMRNFDVYEGHSWAGGYGDNNSGNNQESASEATFAWAGLYLWGLVTGQDKYRDAGIWGYTSEINAIEEYWFDYDNTNWAEDYTIPYVGMVWGSGYTNGTYFSGNPCCIMGIHLLPVTPAIAYMGYDAAKAREIYTLYEQIQVQYQAKVAAEGNVDPEGWFHILWPYLSLGNSEEAVRRFADDIYHHWQVNEDGSISYNEGALPVDELFNSYWFIQNMAAKGEVATDVWASNHSSFMVFKKGGAYKATVWNPYDYQINVEFRNAGGRIGSVVVAPHATVSVDPFANTDKSGIIIPSPLPTDKQIIVPGVVEAEDYYRNFGINPDTHATEGAYMGWVDDNDSLDYKLDVLEAGTYVVEYRVIKASNEKNAVITLESSLSKGVTLSSTTLNLPSDNEWHTVRDQVNLAAGEQDLKLRFTVGGANINWFKLYKVGTKAPVALTEGFANTDLSSHPKLTIQSATCSSSSSDEFGATSAIDGNWDSTRWESLAQDPQWIVFDLGSTKEIGGIKIKWEAAAAKNYYVQVSNDNQNWTNAVTRLNYGGGTTESIEFDDLQVGRYVRIYGTERCTGYGYSIFETEIYGKGNGQKICLASPSVNVAQSGSNAVINFSSVANAVQYNIYRVALNSSTTLLTSPKVYATTNSLSYTDSNLTKGTYTYWVTAVPSSNNATYKESLVVGDGKTVTIVNGSSQQIVDVTSVNMNQTNAQLAIGQNLSLSATVLPTNATNKSVSWSSSNTGVATVNGGYVTAVGGGTAVITARSGNYTATCTITVAAGQTNPSVQYKYEAEDYVSMEGIASEACSEGTNNIGWIDANDWMDYNVNVAAGNYKLVLRYAGTGQAGVAFQKNGTNLTTVTLPATGGWQTWTSIESGAFTLAGGAQTLRVYFTAGGCNLNYFELVAVGGTTNPTNPENPSNPGTTQGKLTIASASSSTVMGTNVAGNAIDNDTNSRWESEFVDNANITFDLGSTKSVNKVVLNWEGAYGKAYYIQVSTDGSNYQTVYTQNNGNGGIETLTFNAVNARYVRLQGVTRGTGWGYSLWEAEIHGGTGSGATNPENPSNPGTTEGKLTIASASSSAVMGANEAGNAIDSDTNTRWESQFVDNANITFDLGSTKSVNKVVLNWEGAYGKVYYIQVSTDGSNYQTVYTQNNGNGGIETLTFNAVNARYVRLQGVTRGTGWGYSLWEAEIHGTTSSGSGSTTPSNPTTGQGKLAVASATSSTVMGTNNVATNAIDNNADTRWESEYTDNENLTLDLGSVKSVNKVVLNWEGAYGKVYYIQVSTDGVNYQTVYTENNGDGGIDTLTFATTNARYVRMQGGTRGIGYGYSLWEMEVHN